PAHTLFKSSVGCGGVELHTNVKGGVPPVTVILTEPLHEPAGTGLVIILVTVGGGGSVTVDVAMITWLQVMVTE
ncbi:MAG TPA: hypothetical protein VN763_05540, partial [Saprospiraceae bacterium]|nr:hypothetical protein [Saprospiraceae bacterium]